MAREVPNLDQIASEIGAIKNTNLFNTEKDTVVGEEKGIDIYKGEHKSTIHVNIFFGPIWIKEALGIEIVESDSKTPVYHYASSHYGSVLRGKYLVRGNLYLYETKTSQLHATIAKYKKMLESDKTESSVREIVSQRMNLFSAGIETQLITRYGISKAKSIVKSAIESITSEIINGPEWRVPKLVIVSGNITDTDPVIDVYEDIDFNKDSKTIMADGATQIRSYGFMARKRPIKDKPATIIEPNKLRIDLEKTVNNYVKKIVAKLKENTGVRIESTGRPWILHPNNLMYTGTLPEVITGWGPELCMVSFAIKQKGMPNQIKQSIDVYTNRYYIDIAGVETLESGPTLIANGYSIPSPWMTFYPDADILIDGIRTISKTFPTSNALSYSWLVPPPPIPLDSDTIYKDEDTLTTTGSVLTHAFMNVRYETARSNSVFNKGFVNSTHRLPVRDYSYISLPRYFTNPKRIESYYPIHAEYGRKTLKDNINIDWENPNALGNIIKEPYSFDQWYVIYPTGAALDYFLGTFSSWGSALVEWVTLGVASNSDEVDNTDLELENFPAYGNNPVQTLGVQVIPMARNLSIDAENEDNSGFSFTNMMAETMEVILDSGIAVLGSAGLLLDDLIAGHKINDPMPYMESERIRCLTNPKDKPKYIWTFRDSDPTKNPTLRLSTQWDRESLVSIRDNDEMPFVMVRIFSQTPKLITTKNKDKLPNLDSSTTFIAPSASSRSSELTVNIDIRTDRSYMKFPKRPPFNWLENLAYDTEQVNQGFSDANDWLLTTKSMNIFKRIALLITVDTLGIVGAGASVIFGGANTAVDMTSQMYDAITALPILSTALDVLDTIGIDLKGIFRDSLIDNSYKLNNIVVYAGKMSYVVELSRLSKLILEQLLSALDSQTITRRAILDNKKVISSGNLDRNAKDNAHIHDLVHTRLESEMRKQFTADGWIIIPVNSTQADRLNLSESTVNGNNYESLILFKNNTTPSSLIIDKVLREDINDLGLTDEEKASVEEETKGIVF